LVVSQNKAKIKGFPTWKSNSCPILIIGVLPKIKLTIKVLMISLSGKFYSPFEVLCIL